MLLLLLAALSAGIVFWMSRVGKLDHPVARSSHARPTPKGGGVGIATAFAAGMALAPSHLPGDAALTASALFLAGCSYLDDVLAWPFWRKLAAQTIASAAILLAGFTPWHLAVPGWGVVGLPAAAPLAGFGWLLFVTNAVNFMDGLNGLAAGSAAAACAVLAVSAGRGIAWPECLILAGVAGFLPFNYPRARIFMGDVGSQFLGFLLAALALRHAAEPPLSTIVPLSLAPMALDAAFTLARRWRAGEPVTQAHRGHLYQIAHRTGMPAWLVSFVYVGMAVCGGLGGAEAGATQSILPAILALTPCLAWAAYTLHTARRADIGAW